MKYLVPFVFLMFLAACSPEQNSVDMTSERTARTQPDTQMELYAPSQHELFDGAFNIVGRSLYQVGSLNDSSPWDHMGNDASNVRAVAGEVVIDVNEIENSGTFYAQLILPEGTYRIELDRFNEFSPCQDGGIAAYLFEHGNAGCGDSNWPKSLLYVAGWGYGKAMLDGETLYEDYEIHFMVTQGMRDRESLSVQLSPTRGEAGSINPATQQVDFYIRSPERNDSNHPNREVFDHFFAMEVTWK
ncbi:MAG: hypothetical protein COB20_04075 [SAR86 cluster bacterium]|uniref:Uncharacterized protein n=1 Tax=SAR86 cluster bacterium TaxID=2030880 RepID=A0A2A4XB28_9GAMM|nr:MAG: hypothetical protein COB20_04075 [SAR86 cluster bacterium]